MQPLEPLSGLSQQEPLPARIHSNNVASLMSSWVQLTRSWNAGKQTQDSCLEAFVYPPRQQIAVSDINCKHKTHVTEHMSTFLLFFEKSKQDKHVNKSVLTHDCCSVVYSCALAQGMPLSNIPQS